MQCFKQFLKIVLKVYPTTRGKIQKFQLDLSDQVLYGHIKFYTVIINVKILFLKFKFELALLNPIS